LVAKQERAVATREALISAAGEVFSRMHFETARVADILAVSSVTQGAFYFHFPKGKIQIAEVVIERQNEKFVQVRDDLAKSDLDGLSGLLELSEALGRLLQSDPIAQAGIRLVTQASTLFPGTAHLPDPEWLQVMGSYLYRASGEGNLRKGVDIPVSTKTIVYLFTGAQVSSFVNDAWAELPDALAVIEPFVLHALAVDGYVRARLTR
jgi:AcrR family transcriptional regulator